MIFQNLVSIPVMVGQKECFIPKQQLIYLQSSQQHVLAQQAIFSLARMEDEYTVLNENCVLKFLYFTILHITEKR
jgi:hypothetical protein